MDCLEFLQFMELNLTPNDETCDTKALGEGAQKFGGCLPLDMVELPSGMTSHEQKKFERKLQKDGARLHRAERGALRGAIKVVKKYITSASKSTIFQSGESIPGLDQNTK
jgi:hypothetical protein